jgi:hypothetical protein
MKDVGKMIFPTPHRYFAMSLVMDAGASLNNSSGLCSELAGAT